jgi:hypothetical protein
MIPRDQYLTVGDVMVVLSLSRVTAPHHRRMETEDKSCSVILRFIAADLIKVLFIHQLMHT